LLCECITSETSGLTRTAPIGKYAEESAYMSERKMRNMIPTFKYYMKR
jgi:hypothetical protein